MRYKNMPAAALAAYAAAILFGVLGYAATNAGAGGWAAAAFVLAVLFALTGVASEGPR